MKRRVIVSLIGVFIISLNNKLSALENLNFEGGVTLGKTVIYSEPTTKSKILFTLKMIQQVAIISNININSNNWYLIDTGGEDLKTHQLIKGWVLKENIAESKDFERVKTFKEYYINGAVGDFEFSMRFYKNGIYKSLIIDEMGRNEGWEIGHLYQYKNIISIGGKGFLYFDKNGDLLSEWQNEEGEPYKAITDKSKFPNFGKPPISIYYLLTGDAVNVRAEASTNAAVLVKLSKGAKVTLLKRSDIALAVGGKKGFWAYIDTGVSDRKGGTVKGWVFDAYLKEEGK